MRASTISGQAFILCSSSHYLLAVSPLLAACPGQPDEESDNNPGVEQQDGDQNNDDQNNNDQNDDNQNDEQDGEDDEDD